jgi:hypothetical protein
MYVFPDLRKILMERPFCDDDDVLEEKISE